MSYSISVIYSIDKTYLKGSSGSADASATATYSGYDGTWPSSSNWGGYKVLSVSSSVELKNWMSSTEATVKAYIGDTKVGEFDIDGGNEETCTSSGYGVSGYTIQGILNKTPISISGSRGSSTGTGNFIQFKSDFILNVEYELPKKYSNCSAPTSVSADKSSVAPNKTFSLSWSGASGGTNTSVSGYSIQRSTDSSSGYSEVATATSSPKTITIPNSNGTTYYYKVLAVSSPAGYNSDLSSQYASVKAESTAPSISSFTLAGQSSDVYIGGTSATVAAKWTGSSGTNNAITGYGLIDQTNNDYSTTYSSTGTSLSKNITVRSGHKYQGYTVGASSNSDNSDSITVSAIALNLDGWNVTSNPSPGNISSRSISFNWDTPTLTTGVASSIKYTIGYTSNAGITGNLLTNGTSNSTTVSLPTTIVAGDPTVIYITATVTARDGGSNSWTKTLGTYKLAGAPKAPTITEFWDVNGPSSLTTGIQTIGYRNIHLRFSAAKQDTSTGSGSVFTYKLRYWKNNETFKTEDLTTVGAITRNLETYAVEPGESISFQIEAKDEFGTPAVSNTVTMRRFVLPTITWNNCSVSSNGSTAAISSPITNTITGAFTGNIPSASGSVKVNYSISLHYGSYQATHVANASGSFETTNQNTFSLEIACPKSTDTTNTFQTELYKQVITNKNPRPQGTLKITYSYDGWSTYSTSSTYNFNFNFVRPIGKLSSSNYSVLYTGSRSYFNPFEKYKIQCNDLNWRGASGESGKLGATIYKTLKRNNSVLSIDSNNQATDSYDQYTASNITLNYYLSYDIVYGNGETLPDQIGINVPIYRWYEDKHTITSVEINATNKTLSGRINLPATLCSSSGTNLATINNVKNIAYTLLDLNKTGTAQTIKTKTQVTSTEISRGYIEFTVSNYTSTNFSLQAQIEYTNNSTDTSNNQIIALSNVYVKRQEGATVAVRKGRIGINVEETYGTNDVKEQSATVKVFQHDNATNTVFDIDANPDGAGFAVLKVGASQVGTIGKTSDNKKLVISGHIKYVNTELTGSKWSNNQYILEDADITATSLQEVLPAPNIATAELKAFQKANIIGGTQQKTKCTLISHGTVPTSVNIPILLMIQGG